uniref:Phosphoinositide phospholipase C n=1 Tax=Rhodosorus marinus TaxID=101924 RepID=A0A7S3AAL2_9RHOD|mmetsp:Transcript_9370/g.40702  ORF Transcript_9370/g.40702 Transcript_9370/m.40702 type:complete len:692 (+) Transcript_9370:289-2364(+)|eukprot:CAMPEP_0113965526 /NCGR_PEP_ID=MMETSP0011_2-20120614/7797_1 /TAXON_ID=101924 /ORGANISM="Rhodosorus marinus" /LENGTH=691 /DNA_ID=CAMNT_0000978055 /DNA_START=187 /DNA_END=2262 /DNA_ORIENTATION=- /assembly_acc=CAM_ASM_000156
METNVGGATSAAQVEGDSKTAGSYFDGKTFEVSLQGRFCLRRKRLMYVDTEKQLLVLKRPVAHNVHPTELHFADIYTASLSERVIIVRGRQRDIDMRFNADADIDQIYRSLRDMIGNAHDGVTLGSRFAIAQQLFREADKDRTGTLSLHEVADLLKKMNNNVERSNVVEIFKKADRDDNQRIDEDEFMSIYKEIAKRKTVLLKLFLEYAELRHPQVMTKAELQSFLVNEQKMTGSEAKQQSGEIMKMYGDGNTIDVDGFLEFLQSGKNFGAAAEMNSEPMDMSRPLCDYFIASSHNTYLEGNQLTGSVSAESYVNAVKAGARCVEIDLWEDDDGEPTVTHGRTLTGEMHFADVVKAYGSRKLLFGSSPYPLILSFEDHMTAKSRQRMVEIMKDSKEFYSMLGKPSDYPALDAVTPEQLREKILIKMKIKPETPDELKELIFVEGGKYRGSWEEAMGTRPLTCFSHDESRLEQFVEEDESDELVRFNKIHFTRVYPAGVRIGSSNFDPSKAWLCGCQLVALNYQTKDKYYIINKTFFELNAGRGYILKIPRLLNMAALDTQTMVEVKVLYGQNINYSDSDIYVSVRATCCRGVSKYKIQRISDSGLSVAFPHAVEEDEPAFSFDVHCKELSCIVITVKHQSKLTKRKTRIYAVIPVRILRQGYRACPLFDVVNGHALPPYVQLFCHFTVKDG